LHRPPHPRAPAAAGPARGSGPGRRRRLDRCAAQVRPLPQRPARHLRPLPHPRRDPRQPARPRLVAARAPPPGPRAQGRHRRVAGKAAPRPLRRRNLLRPLARARRLPPPARRPRRPRNGHRPRRRRRRPAHRKRRQPRSRSLHPLRPGRKQGPAHPPHGELPERDQQILSLYYFEELTMKEVGAVLGIGESRISQIHSALLTKLRLRLRSALRPTTPTTPRPPSSATAQCPAHPPARTSITASALAH